MSKISYLTIKRKEIVSDRGGLNKILGRKWHLSWAFNPTELIVLHQVVAH